MFGAEGLGMIKETARDERSSGADSGHVTYRKNEEEEE